MTSQDQANATVRHLRVFHLVLQDEFGGVPTEEEIDCLFQLTRAVCDVRPALQTQGAACNKSSPTLPPGAALLCPFRRHSRHVAAGPAAPL
jgi:hypothetical protein